MARKKRRLKVETFRSTARWVENAFTSSTENAAGSLLLVNAYSFRVQGT